MAAGRGIMLGTLVQLIGIALQDTGNFISLTNTWTQTYSLGDDFNISCVVNGHIDQTINFVRMRDGNDEIITENNVILRPSLKGSRYTVVMVKLENNTLIATLYITDLEANDGGRLGCKLGTESTGFTAYAGKELTIHVPITEVRLANLAVNDTWRWILPGQRLRLRNNNKVVRSGVKCEVTVLWGCFEPEMSLRVGTKDILSRFKKSTERTWIDKNGVMQRGYRLTLTYITYHPPVGANGKTLFCKATVPTFPSRIAKAPVNVTYPPRFDCKTSQYSLRGDHSFRLNCMVMANPWPTHYLWWWPLGEQEETIFANSHEHKFIMEKQIVSRDTIIFSLRISKVTSDVFRVYILEVENSMGKEMINIKLVEGVDPDGMMCIHDSDVIGVVAISLASGYMAVY